MRVVILALLLATSVSAQDLEILVRPEAVYVENIGENVVPMERVFFHIVVHNISKAPIEIQWVRFDIVNAEGILFSGQYSGNALSDLFDQSRLLEIRRVEVDIFFFRLNLD